MSTKICTRMFTGVLSVMTQTVETTNYFPREGYLNKWAYIHSIEYTHPPK